MLVDFFKFGLIRPNNGRVVAIYRLKLVNRKVTQNPDSNQYSGVCIVLHTDLPPLCLNCECVCVSVNERPIALHWTAITVSLSFQYK